MDDTYVTFTTHRRRVGKIGPMLSSLLEQWPAQRVVLTVAYDLELPDFIQRSGIRIVRSADYGAFKKHSPLYADLGIRQYIVVDDDSLFPAGWFDNLVDWRGKLPGHVVCGRARLWEAKDTLRYPHSRVIHCNQVRAPVPAHSYVGIGTALFRTEFFEKDVFPFPRNYFTYSDDIWFSAKLKDGVKIYVVPYSCAEQCGTVARPQELDYAGEDACLWKTARTEDYAAWNVALHRHRNKLLARA